MCARVCACVYAARQCVCVCVCMLLAVRARVRVYENIRVHVCAFVYAFKKAASIDLQLLATAAEGQWIR